MFANVQCLRTQNSRRAASVLVRLEEGEEIFRTSYYLQVYVLRNWGKIHPNSTVTCMVLKSTANDKLNLVLCHDEFRGPRSEIVRQDEVEKLAYQLNEEAERAERPIRRLSKVMYGSTCADMQVDVMGECLSSIKHVVGVRSVFLAKRLHAV
ncbi:uncharacterized protein TNCV_325321 [Trichonephila clavipes]|nr:uncharacterized protein TNCV_325321 [Trichonephila clavipes]